MTLQMLLMFKFPVQLKLHYLVWTEVEAAAGNWMSRAGCRGGNTGTGELAHGVTHFHFGLEILYLFYSLV